MEELLRRHSAIMDKYDPNKRVSLIVDEWGTWYDVEQGTNPGFLYQQNTIRDAVVAALNLNIFHRHADRVRMTNIAQMVNVLQAMLLTDGAQLVKTPTYHVFDLYTDHQDAEFVATPTAPGTTPGALGAEGDFTVSRKDGALTISATNWGLDRELEADFELPGPADRHPSRADPDRTRRRTSHNTFERPEEVALADLAVRVDGRRVRFTLPPHSVATVRVAHAE